MDLLVDWQRALELYGQLHVRTLQYWSRDARSDPWKADLRQREALGGEQAPSAANLRREADSHTEAKLHGTM